MNSDAPLTPWLNGYWKPVRDGVYKRNHQTVSGTLALPYWSRFFGGLWRVACHTKEEAATETAIAVNQYRPWRGLAENPNKKRKSK